MTKYYLTEAQTPVIIQTLYDDYVDKKHTTLYGEYI